MHKKARVLIVEDDGEYTDTYQPWLRAEGYVSSSARNVAEAKSALIYFEPNALILDLALDNQESGFEIARDALRRRIPVVVVTQDPSYANARTAFKDYQVVDFISKGLLSRDTLISAIDSAISLFEGLGSDYEQLRVFRPAEQTMHALANAEIGGGQSSAGLVTSQVQFLPDRRRSFLLSRAAGWGAFGEFVTPFGERTEAVLKVLDEDGAQYLSPEEEVFLRNEGFQLPLTEVMLRDIGHRMYQSLLSPASESKATASEWGMLLAAGERGPDCLQLIFAEQTGLAIQYPWEMLYDGRRFLAQHKTSITRSVLYGESSSELAIEWPTRVLFAAPRPHSIPKLGAEEAETIGRLTQPDNTSPFEFVPVPHPVTYQRVTSMLSEAKNGRPFDIFYFDGHGDYGWRCECGQLNPPSAWNCQDSKCGRCYESDTARRPEVDGFLYFESESGADQPLKSSQSVSVFGEMGLQLVTLSACRSATVAGTSAFNSMAARFLEMGIPAAIGMQFSVNTALTIAFFVQLFQSLAGFPRVTSRQLEQAVHNARKQLASDKFFYPALYVRSESH